MPTVPTGDKESGQRRQGNAYRDPARQKRNTGQKVLLIGVVVLIVVYVAAKVFGT